MKLPFKRKSKKSIDLSSKVGSKVTELGSNTTKHVRRYVSRRAKKLIDKDIGRFVISWLGLVVLLLVVTFGGLWRFRTISTAAEATAGGTYIEGMSGTLNNINPLFSNGGIDDSAARLLYNGLLRYDREGKITTDIAKSYVVDESLKKYSVELRHDVRWHDGRNLTAEDVLFTINTIQNPESRSTQYASWHGIKVSAKGQYELTFELASPLVTFPSLLTQPIIPKHPFKDVAAQNMRTADYNSHPIGTGPFKFVALRNDFQQKQLELEANEDYFRGTPKLGNFILRTYKNDKDLASALADREIAAAVDVKPDALQSIIKDSDVKFVNTPLSSGVFAFFKTTQPKLENTNIRKALAEAIDREIILEQFHARYRPLSTPLLPELVNGLSEPRQITDRANASKLLDEAGWKLEGNENIRKKDGEKLSLTLVTMNNGEYSQLASRLVHQWGEIGVEVKTQALTPEQLQQTALKSHDYDILLYGISFGHDPDVYAYWHSSQARMSGFNFSEWKSSRADVSLAFARVTADMDTRVSRYKIFQDEWVKQAPAVALYQPYTTYASHRNAQTPPIIMQDSVADRLTDVEDWTVLLHPTMRTP